MALTDLTGSWATEKMEVSSTKNFTLLWIPFDESLIWKLKIERGLEQKLEGHLLPFSTTLCFHEFSINKNMWNNSFPR